MKIALISDLHGNLPATEAVAKDIARRHVDAIYCLGDLVGKGPSSRETAEWAFAHCDIVLQGNWDEAITSDENPVPVVLWTKSQLGESCVKKIKALPFEHRFTFAGRRVRLIHGRPLVSDVIYSDSPAEERTALFRTGDGYAPEIVGFADIHQPFYQHINPAGILFNTGSVGNPLGGQPFASYVLLEGEMSETLGPISHTIVQLPYDREEAIRQALACPGLPYLDAYINELRTGQYSR